MYIFCERAITGRETVNPSRVFRADPAVTPPGKDVAFIMCEGLPPGSVTNNKPGYARAYSVGAVTRTHAPSPGTGAGVTYVDVPVSHDALGRPERVERFVGQTGQGYKKFVYDNDFNNAHTYETLTGMTQADEFHSWVVIDGTGRVRASAADHPGSAGGFSGSYVVYDNMGRPVEWSNTTNARNQVETINQQGQVRTFDYNGHGRLWHRTTPEQGQTTYTYNADDRRRERAAECRRLYG